MLAEEGSTCANDVAQREKRGGRQETIPAEAEKVYV